MSTFTCKLPARFFALFVLICTYSFTAFPTFAQQRIERELKPDSRRARLMRLSLIPDSSNASASSARKGGYQPMRGKSSLPKRASQISNGNRLPRRAQAARVSINSLIKSSSTSTQSTSNAIASLPPIKAGTSLAYVLHASQLSNISAAGSLEQFADQNANLEADQRTTFNQAGGSFDVAVGRNTGTRYEVFSAVDDRGTSNPNDDLPIGALVVGVDSNGDFVRDSSSTYDLRRDFSLPSAASVVSGTSRANREFVVVSSSGYYNFDNPNDPNNEISAGVVLLVRDTATGGFDNARSRELVRAGSNKLNNANALALLPNNDLLIADFDSNELRIVRDTDNDGMPDTLDDTPFYSYKFSDDAPLDIAANSRGVVFSHSLGNDTVLLAIYDDNKDGRGDADEVAVEGLSLDNNLILHGLTVDREGNVYVIEDASGAADTVADGGNLGTPRVDVFPDPALNGLLRDGQIFLSADQPATQSLAGLAFGFDASLGQVNPLTLVNSASLVAPAPREGLATVSGAGLTFGRSGATQNSATANGVRVIIEGRSVPVLSFSNSQINIYLPVDVSTGANSVLVIVDGYVTAADDASISVAHPGLFTYTQNGAGEAIALLVSANRYTRNPFPSTVDGQPSVIALFGTGWRNSLPLTVTIGGQAASVQYAGKSGGFNGLDQINVTIPPNIHGAANVVVKTANGSTSRSDALITVQ